MLWLTRSLCSTGKAVIMDNGFCFLKGLLETRNRGVYGSALIKRGSIGLGRFMETVLMSTSGQKILGMWDVLVANGTRKRLNHPEVVSDPYKYRGSVDNHNALSHYGKTESQIGLYIAWGTTWYPIWVFDFSKACTEINTYLVMKYFLNMYDSFMNFWMNLEKVLINNSYINEKTRGIPLNTRKIKYHTYWRLNLLMILVTTV